MNLVPIASNAFFFLNYCNSQDVSPIIRGLYDDQPHECKSDGRRFRAKEDLQRHLDKLFAINKARKDGTGIKERQWFRKVEDWVMCTDVIERPTPPTTVDVKNSNRMEIEITKSEDKAEEEENSSERVPAEEFEHGVRYCIFTTHHILVGTGGLFLVFHLISSDTLLFLTLSFRKHNFWILSGSIRFAERIVEGRERRDFFFLTTLQFLLRTLLSHIFLSFCLSWLIPRFLLLVRSTRS